jgi:phage recombination protein Bet
MNNDKKNFMSEEDIKTLTQAGIIPDGTPAAIVKVFALACANHNLSPFKKEIYLVKYNTKTGVQYHTIVGIDGLRAKAARTGQFAGRDDAKYDLQPDGKFFTASQIAGAKKMPISCTITVYRMVGGQRCPFTKTVVFAEYYPAVANPNPDRRDFSKAATMPFNMIEKCAEAAVLRMAFAEETEGLHIPEESAAFEDSTLSAAETRPELTIDAADLEDRLSQVWTIPVLMEVYKENPAHKEFAQLFTDRRLEIEAMIENGQLQQ